MLSQRCREKWKLSFSSFLLNNTQSWGWKTNLIIVTVPSDHQQYVWWVNIKLLLDTTTFRLLYSASCRFNDKLCEEAETEIQTLFLVSKLCNRINSICLAPIPGTAELQDLDLSEDPYPHSFQFHSVSSEEKDKMSQGSKVMREDIMESFRKREGTGKSCETKEVVETMS